MNSHFLPACYFPTTVAFVDDNRNFLEGLRVSLDKSIADCRFFDDGMSLLEFLQTRQNPPAFINECIQRPEELHKFHRQLDIDVTQIIHALDEPARFQQTAIIVIDFAMPVMNGIALSQKIRELDPTLKIILLTGEASQAIAIDAFNNGLIQHYIRKDETNFGQQLSSAISQLQWEYFQNMTEVIINSLTHHPEYPPSCLNDKVFVRFFNQLREELECVEFYLIEDSGSFVLLTETGKPTWLVIKDTELMDGMLFDVEHCDFDVADTILQALQKRTHMLFFNNNDALWSTPEQWPDYLFPCQNIPDSQFYYALLKDPAQFTPSLRHALSYQNYRRKLQK